jgi:hypothetical protein
MLPEFAGYPQTKSGWNFFQLLWSLGSSFPGACEIFRMKIDWIKREETGGVFCWA